MMRSNVILILLLTALAASSFSMAAYADVSLYSPSEIAVDGNGNVYTIMNIDSATGEGIFAYAADGTEVTSVRRPGCTDIAIDGSGTVYVLNIGQKQVERLEKDGSFSVVWREDTPDHFINYFTTDRDGNILVSDFNYSMAEISVSDGCILKISPGGTVLDVIEGSPGVPLNKTFRMSVSSNGTIYLTDLSQCFMAIYPDGSGSTIASMGPDNSTFGQVMTVEAGDDGYLYVGEMSNGSVRKLTADGTLVAVWEGCGPDRFITPSSIVASRDGRVYVSDMRNQRIVWFDSASYRFGDDLTENLAGKGILWDNIIAGDNYTITHQTEEGNGGGQQVTPGFSSAVALIGIGIACLFINRMRRK